MKKSLDRFLIAQQNYYHDAYEELKVGKKRSHWMWFIFPQIRGLGYSNMAIYYAIESREEAENYITDPTLGHNLIQSTYKSTFSFLHKQRLPPNKYQDGSLCDYS